MFKTPLLGLCFDFRDDIVFRAYVLQTNNKKAWKQFCALRGNRKVTVKKLYKMRDSLAEEGQKTAINVVKYQGKLYPADGATRLGCMLALGFKKVKATKNTITTSRKWNDPKNIDTRHFDGMSKEIISEFVEFRNRLFGHDRDNPHKREYSKDS